MSGCRQVHSSPLAYSHTLQTHSSSVQLVISKCHSNPKRLGSSTRHTSVKVKTVNINQAMQAIAAFCACVATIFLMTFLRL